MKITKITNSATSDFKFFESMYLNSFPEEERRPVPNIESLIANSERFFLYLLEHDNQQVGFISIWELEEFSYVEHFAIHEDFRSMRLGSVSMKTLLDTCKLPLILEVEPPIDEIAVKRVKFYERLGFKISDYDYIQPPYTPELSSLSLKLMEYGGDLTFTQPQTVENTLHQVVYGVIK